MWPTKNLSQKGLSQIYRRRAVTSSTLFRPHSASIFMLQIKIQTSQMLMVSGDHVYLKDLTASITSLICASVISAKSGSDNPWVPSLCATGKSALVWPLFM